MIRWRCPSDSKFALFFHKFCLGFCLHIWWTHIVQDSGFSGIILACIPDIFRRTSLMFMEFTYLYETSIMEVALFTKEKKVNFLFCKSSDHTFRWVFDVYRWSHVKYVSFSAEFWSPIFIGFHIFFTWSFCAILGTIVILIVGVHN